MSEPDADLPPYEEVEEGPPSPARYAEGEEEGLWHNVKAYLRNPNGPEPIITCPVCQVDELDIRGLGAGRYSRGNDDIDLAVVLPCGHMIGRRCLEQSNRAREAGFLVCRCPLCNFELQYQDPECCAHTIEGIFAPSEERHSLDRVPPTIPEGGLVPLVCNDCRVESVTDAALELGDFVWNPYGEFDGDIPPRVHEFVYMMQERLREQMEEERRPSWADHRDYMWEER